MPVISKMLFQPVVNINLLLTKYFQFSHHHNHHKVLITDSSHTKRSMYLTLTHISVWSMLNFHGVLDLYFEIMKLERWTHVPKLF